MKTYEKPIIDMVTLASSTQIAAKSCTGDNCDDYDLLETIITEANGKTYVTYVSDNGSN